MHSPSYVSRNSPQSKSLAAKIPLPMAEIQLHLEVFTLYSEYILWFNNFRADTSKSLQRKLVEFLFETLDIPRYIPLDTVSFTMKCLPFSLLFLASMTSCTSSRLMRFLNGRLQWTRVEKSGLCDHKIWTSKVNKHFEEPKILMKF